MLNIVKTEKVASKSMMMMFILQTYIHMHDVMFEKISSNMTSLIYLASSCYVGHGCSCTFALFK